MDITALITFISIGAVAGWLAGNIIKGSFGVVGNIVIGIVGAFLGGFAFSLVGISAGGLIGSLNDGSLPSGPDYRGGHPMDNSIQLHFYGHQI